jgi:hypothetical protein
MALVGYTRQHLEKQAVVGIPFRDGGVLIAASEMKKEE